MTTSNKKANALMGDLESIKALLEEDELEAVPEAGARSLSEALNPPIPNDLGELDELDDLDAAAPILVDPLNSFDPKTGLSTPLSGNDDAAIQDDATRPGGQVSNLTPSATKDTPTPNTSSPNLESLLTQEFHAATSAAMTHARTLINDNPNNWSPQQTDELADALRVRIDDAVQRWIQTSLAIHAHELQDRLLDAVRNELASHLASLHSTPDD